MDAAMAEDDDMAEWAVVGALPPASNRLGEFVIDDYLAVGTHAGDLLAGAGTPPRGGATTPPKPGDGKALAAGPESPRSPSSPPRGPGSWEQAWEAAESTTTTPIAANMAAAPEPVPVPSPTPSKPMAAPAAPAAAAQEPSVALQPAEVTESLFRCFSCSRPVFEAGEIISSNYHAMTGPGCLVRALRNVRPLGEEQTVVYTTGRYTIQEVACEQCDSSIGVTYVGAADARNQHKVGQFLVGWDRLTLPADKAYLKVQQ